tara:strand:- start:7315 stop:8298 length:984 start_codon:yes stop_codon:yes gene_type:complete
MSKKIVIVPTFAESHLIKCQIPNIIDTINPDYIVYQEGLFPNGTEGNKKYTTEWLDKYTTDGKRGFDWEELQKIVYDAQNEYPNTEIILNTIDYQQGMTSTDCYVKACLNLEDLGIKFEEGDYIFPYEGDVFHHEKDKKDIDGYMNQIEPGQGFRSIWVDYMQNFWYSEKCRIKPWLGKEYDEEGNYMSRRICLRYDEGGVFYKNVLDNFMTTDYHNPVNGYGMLYPTDLITYHYAWIRPGKFRELRCDQLQRQDGYWERFVQGLDLADELQYDEILIRPGVKQWTNGWIKYFDKLEHPKHVKNHELWFEVEDDVKEKIVADGKLNE